MRFLFFLAFVFNCFYMACIFSTNAVISEYSGGRFGDNLLSFSHTLYFSIKNKCEMFLIPFNYSNQLMLDNFIQKYSHNIQSRYNNKVIFPGRDVFIDKDIKNTLFVVPYFPHSPVEYFIRNTYKSFVVEWDNYDFKQELRKLIAPKNALSLIQPPKDKISVAVHVRTGGGSDVVDYHNWTTEEFIHRFYKFPLEEYYITQIKNLSKLLGHPPLYVFLFTDDQNPLALVESYSKKINIPSIQFDYRKSGNRHDLNVLEDFFSMVKFDILIRPNSNFSIMTEKIGDYKIVISPTSPLPGSYVNRGLICINKPLD